MKKFIYIKRLIFFLLISYLPYTVHSQNLVPNGDFEAYTSCPSWGNIGVRLAPPWFGPCPNTTTGGGGFYYHSCDTTFYTGIPWNNYGYCPAHSGNGYADVLTYISLNRRTYIEVPLVQPLVAGTIYCVSYYVSLSDISRNATEELDAYLSVDSVTIPLSNCDGLINLVPQIQNQTGPLIDTTGWILVADTFVAAGGEKYLTIGNFKSNSQSNIVVANSSSILWYAVYYVDDVSVVAGMCATNISVMDEKNIVSISPSPAATVITIKAQHVQGKKAMLYIYSTLGVEECRKEIIVNRGHLTHDMFVGSLSNGAYIVKLQTENEVLSGKFVKQ